MTSFLQLYKHFFEPRLLSLLVVENAETDALSSDSSLDENDNDAAETDDSTRAHYGSSSNDDDDDNDNN